MVLAGDYSDFRPIQQVLLAGRISFTNTNESTSPDPVENA